MCKLHNYTLAWRGLILGLDHVFIIILVINVVHSMLVYDALPVVIVTLGQVLYNGH